MGAKGNVKDNVPAEVGGAPKQTLPNIINPNDWKEEIRGKIAEHVVQSWDHAHRILGLLTEGA